MGKKRFILRFCNTITTVPRVLRVTHGNTLMRLGIVLMAFAALIWLSYEFYRLLQQPTHIASFSISPGAIDLKMRYEEVHYWFEGKDVYRELSMSSYPPASYIFLWPLLGWVKVSQALWLWTATAIAALVWLIYIIIRESGADKPLDRVFVSLIPLSMYATGATIGNGQLIIHILPILITGLLLLKQGTGELRNDLISAVLFLVALVKPSVSAPFFWIVFFVPGRLRPVFLIICGYIVATFLAASFQKSELFILFQDWSSRAVEISSYESLKWSHNNLHSWLAAFGLQEWNSYASLFILACLGFWTYRHRHCDLWYLLGVSALVARIWTYHGWYDDLLILLPMIVLFRISKQGFHAEGGDIVAGILLGLTLLAMLAPGGLYLLPAPWNIIYVNIQAVIWIIILIFLLDRTRMERKRMLEPVLSLIK